MKLALALSALIALASPAFAAELGPPKFWVDADGHHIATTRDVVENGVTIRTVTPPAGARQVPTAPPGPGMIWTVSTTQWTEDPDYVAPTPPAPEPDVMSILDLLVERGVITEADKNGLLGDATPRE